MKFLNKIEVKDNTVEGVFNGEINDVTLGELVISDRLTINESGIFGTDAANQETFSLFSNTGVLKLGDFSSGDINVEGTLTIPSGNIIGLNSTNITDALGFTPYNNTNPNGYISSYTETDPVFSA